MTQANPFLTPWSENFGLPPFEIIDETDFAPAFDAGFAQHRENIAEISGNPEAPSFANTIEALERASPILDRVSGVFHNLTSADTNETLQGLERELGPKFAELHAEMIQNADLFARIQTLYEARDQLALDPEQLRVLELYHRMFVRSGAKLNDQDAAELTQIMKRLSELGTRFVQNLLADERDWVMELDLQDLEGCPDFLIAAAQSAAQERDKPGAIITLSRSLIVPFLQFSPRRDLRERAFAAWVARGNNPGDTNNCEITAETLKLRHRRAEILGFECFADFKLAPEMAGSPENVQELLMAVWKPAKHAAKQDAEKLAALMAQDGVKDSLRPWDWRYYAERLRAQTFDLDEAELKPYFQLDQMIAASFKVAKRLFDLDFTPLDLPLYHQDARAWEVTRNGQHMAVFIGDYFARPSKRSGAWCSRFRAQSNMDQNQRAHVINVCNFAKAPDGQPSLLNYDDARTLFHEFGHALHTILSDVTYAFISGTSVARDFVELPSQLYEHWLSVPEILEEYATHAKTGQPIPKEMLDRLLAAENFDQGFATVEYTASALVDLAFHTEEPPTDTLQKQAEILDRIGMPEAITMRHATPHFAHVFAGDGYSSGYYSYLWSEVMDADAFNAFEETGDVFDADLAQKLEEYIYAAGGSKPADVLYTAFRGALPKVEALLKGRGLAS